MIIAGYAIAQGQITSHQYAEPPLDQASSSSDAEALQEVKSTGRT